MDDSISRQAAIEAAIEGADEWDGGYSHSRDEAITNAIGKVPSVQQEIIRCKDCKWKQGSECVRFAEVRPFPDDFCSRAERRTDETD